MSIVLNGDSGITTPTYGGADTSEYLVPVTQFKNRIINGAMVIDQRNAGASVTPANNTYTLDRWGVYMYANSGKFSVQRNAGSVTPPAGFTNYLGVTSLSAYSVTSADIYAVYQRIEGLNVTDLGFGTANAKTITVSFWVRSSLTGTFGASINNSAGNRCYPFTYTISSANTWEQKSVTIPGDTTGTWRTDNDVGIQLNFGLGGGTDWTEPAGAWTSNTAFSVDGATSVVGTNGATWYVTGCQLEIGSTATSFDYRPYGTELMLCQRYYFRNTPGSIYSQLGFFGTAGNTSSIVGPAMMPVIMRTTPTVTASNARLADGANGLTFSAITIAWNGAWATELTFSVTGATQYRPYYLQNNNSASGYIDFSAEL